MAKEEPPLCFTRGIRLAIEHIATECCQYKTQCTQIKILPRSIIRKPSIANKSNKQNNNNFQVDRLIYTN